MLLYLSLPRLDCLVRGLLLGLLLLGLCACNGKTELPWAAVIPKGGTAPPYQPPPTTNHLVVYLDTSGSMAGYVSPDKKTVFGAQPDGNTVFTHTLRALRDEAASSFEPPVNVVYRQVTADVSEPVFSDLKLAESAINRATYTGGETNLAGAISLFSVPVEPAANGKGAGENSGDSPPPARFHILITDGVQSTRQQRTDMNCTSGSDTVCVKNAVRKLLNNGWAGCVLGVKSEFHGKVYSEVRPGAAVEHASAAGDIKTYRPFYLYIFSRDHKALDKLVAALKQRLRQIESLKNDSTAVREYALTAPYAEGNVQSELVIPRQASSYLERTRAKDESPPRLTLRVSLDTERANVGPQPFSFLLKVPWSEHAKDSGSPEALPGLLRWALVPIVPEGTPAAGAGRYPEVTLLGPQVNGDGQIELKATARWPQGTGEPHWRAYRLEGRLNLERPVPPWVEEWSANSDVTDADANRTFNLTSALSNLWRNPTLENQLVGEVYLRVGPQ